MIKDMANPLYFWIVTVNYLPETQEPRPLQT